MSRRSWAVLFVAAALLPGLGIFWGWFDAHPQAERSDAGSSRAEALYPVMVGKTIVLVPFPRGRTAEKDGAP